MSYGATGNGVTDDTAAIQEAYTARKEVFFPTGTYKVSVPITLSAGMKMFGHGASQTIINVTSRTAALSLTGDGSAGANPAASTGPSGKPTATKAARESFDILSGLPAIRMVIAIASKSG
jgi:polygalacturonase